MRIELYVGISWSGGDSGEWYTEYVDIPDGISEERLLIASEAAWVLAHPGTEVAFLGIYNIPGTEFGEDDDHSETAQAG